MSRHRVSRIDLVYFEGCPHVGPARQNLERALQGAPGTHVRREWNLDADDVPDRFRRYGSPTILIEGVDVTGPGEGRTSARACRIGGAPSADLIRKALARLP